MAGPVPIPPLNVATSSSAGANTGGFSIGGLQFSPNSQSKYLASHVPMIATVAVAAFALYMANR